ncbi:Spore coat polysaccharide biosynthesis protein spsE [Blastochloris viridis]|uniref:Spore coat polysaccharide biosynthesis protein spsE n=1 Tax=Blastochloris viridis TaxID=1079 RepID=A0A0S4Q1H9_BLAVI|nr:Spore coat polysaccharide biosynthesis protein spsE [Blastochloris viridis]
MFGDKKITDDSSPFVIAEVGHNHQGNLERCKAIFHAAAEAGADAVKIQKRDNRTLFTREMYDSHYDSENAYGPTYGTHREFLEFDAAQYRELKEYCDKIGILFFSTAFDDAAADFLAELDMPGYKIASGDLANIALLKKVAAFGKPIIVSTGGATMEDVRRAYDAIMPINSNLCIMQCTSGYPPPHEELNLRVIETFRNAFPDIVIGFSSHDSGIAMPLVGYMLGARVFEKHFTLNRAWKGTDQAFSLEPAGLKRVVRDLERARIALGNGIKTPYPSETSPLNKMVKRVVAARELPAGTVLSADDLAFRIPVSAKITAATLRPFEAEQLVGRLLTRSVSAEELVTLADVGIGEGDAVAV